MPQLQVPGATTQGIGANAMGNLMGTKPGANTAVVPSPNATAATPAQLPSAPKTAQLRAFFAKIAVSPPTPYVDPASSDEAFAAWSKKIDDAHRAQHINDVPYRDPYPTKVQTQQEHARSLGPHAYAAWQTGGSEGFRAWRQQNKLQMSKKLGSAATNVDYMPAAKQHSNNPAAPNMASRNPPMTPNVPYEGSKTSAIIAEKLAGWGQTLVSAGKAALPGMGAGAAIGAVQGAMDPNGSMLGGAAKGAIGGGALGAAAGGMHGHMMQGQGAGAQMYQQGAQQMYGQGKQLLGNMMAPGAPAPQQKAAQLKAFFAKLAGGKWNTPEAQKAMTSGRLQGAWDAHAAQQAPKGKPEMPMQLTHPNDMSRANMLNDFMPKGKFGSECAKFAASLRR
jgi:hypothetical protein